MEIFRLYFYAIDFSIAVGTLIIVIFLYRSGRIGVEVWRLFWIGCALGLMWEVPISTISGLSEQHAILRFIRPPPTHFIAIIISHTLWDGGLFLLGMWFAQKICGAPLFEKFKPAELGVMLVWGQASELWVELTSTLGEAWVYIPRSWNPALFQFNGQDITLLPQLIWFVAPIAFYLIGLELHKNIAKSA